MSPFKWYSINRITDIQINSRKLDYLSITDDLQADKVSLEELNSYVHFHQEVHITVISYRFQDKELLYGANFIALLMFLEEKRGRITQFLITSLKKLENLGKKSKRESFRASTRRKRCQSVDLQDVMHNSGRDR